MQTRADTSYRVLLPSDVEPEKYDLTLEPDLERFTFEGTVKITCDVQVATETIIVHQKELVLSSAVFTPEGGKAMTANEIILKMKEMTASMVFEEVLPVGKGVLEIKFRGLLNDQMAGFYRSKYTNSKGQQKFLATTQFEAIDARRCFPCWDEPARKAVFVVTLLYPNDLMALSNMPTSRLEKLSDGRHRETFMPTPKMSSYLLAFCIGEFEYISDQTSAGVVARVFCCPGSLAKCSYALKSCIRALDFYNDFFGIPYPLPKLDMIAIPDFSAGAMENWGLVTYREVALLCDEATVSSTQKQRICTVVTHELAHQWFGNLVTMQWWDDLWLNEGFANWMQTFAADKLHPEWCIWESYIGTEQQRALTLDALRSSHPIQVPIGKAEEVEEVFDAISYCKGGSVVRMIYAVLGEEQFQAGLRAYFAQHQYGNTETTDLWRAWANASGKPIDQMMGSWTKQMGFPVLKVTSDPLAAGVDEIEVEQSWFLADGSVEAGDEEKTWVTPVIMGSDKGTAPVVFMQQDSKKAKLSCSGVAGSAKWLKLNYGQHVPVRVLYPDSMFARLVQGVPTLTASDKIGLLSDTYALCKAGALDPMQLATLLKGGNFATELNDKVWSELAGVMGGLDKIMRQGLDAETQSAFVDFAAGLVGPVLQEVGWDLGSDDDDNRKKLRSTVMGALSRYCFRDPKVVSEAQARLEAFLAAPADDKALSADIRPAVFSISMQSDSTDALLKRFVKAHDAVTDGAVRIHIYQAMGDVPTAELRTKVLEFCLTEVRSQDLIYIPMSMATASKEGADAVFKWVDEAYDRIYEKLGKTSMILFNHVVRISGAGFASEEKATEVEEFWKSKEVYHMVGKAVSQTCEGVRTNAGFLKRMLASDASKATTWTQ